MQVHEYARNHGITNDKVTKMCRDGRIKARRIGNGNLGFWDVVELWDTFEDITVNIGTKQVGGPYSLTLTYQGGRYILTSHNTTTGHEATTITYDDATDATDEYRDHTWDPDRTADPLNPDAAGDDEPAATAPRWREWTHPGTGQRRRYLTNATDVIGLHLHHYNTGNIAHAELNGDTISNSQAYKLVTLVNQMRVWADDKNQLHYRPYESSNRHLDAADIIAAITAAM